MAGPRSVIYTRIRERYWELSRDGMSQREAVQTIVDDPTLNLLGYRFSYVLDIVARIDPVRKHRHQKKLGNSR